MSAQADLAVVGAGIVGLATARELQRRHPDARIVVVEAEDRVGVHQTGHNSGVIHAGIYYAPGSLKARLCVAGAAALRAFCEEHAIPVKRCGKLIVALDAAEVPALDELERRGRANGVPGLERLDAGALREREPEVAGVAALWSPGTAVVDFGAVARAYAGELTAAGAELRFGWPVRGFAQQAGAVRLEGPGGDTLTATRVVCCAGRQADRLAVRAGAPRDPRIVPFRGAYLPVRPERAGIVSAMVYPVPDPALPFLGVHLTPTPGDGLVIGPTAFLAPGGPRELARTLAWPGTARLAWRHRRAAAIELHHRVSRRALVAAAARYVPSLTAADVAPGGWAGVRAQALSRSGALVDDFAFSRTGAVLHVRNAPSPAATSSPAIAAHIADALDAQR